MFWVYSKSVKLNSSRMANQSSSTNTFTTKLPRNAISPSRLNLASDAQRLR